MEPSTQPPQQYRQTGRRTKRDWRKNVDVSEVQKGLEQARTEQIEGFVVQIQGLI